MNSWRISPVLLLLVVAGCTVGIKLEEFKPAQGPHGVQMEVSLNGEPIRGNDVVGELLAVQADGVLLLVPEFSGRPQAATTIVLVPYWMMKTANLEQMGKAKVESQGEEMNKVYLDRLRMVSRFPQGLSDELLAPLLANYDQESLVSPFREE